MEQAETIPFILFPASGLSYLLFLSAFLYLIVLIIGWKESKWPEKVMYIFLTAVIYACSVKINADAISSFGVKKDPEAVVAEKYMPESPSRPEPLSRPDSMPVTDPSPEPPAKPRKIYPIGSGKRDF